MSGLVFIFFTLVFTKLVFSFPNGVPYYYHEESSPESDVHQILTPLSSIGDTVEDKINTVVNSKTIQFATPFPSSGRKTAVLEAAVKESVPIQTDIKYAKLQQFVASLLNPKPIVDTIKEHEKYGNDGGKFRNLSTQLVGAYEGFSNALNAAVDVI